MILLILEEQCGLGTNWTKGIRFIITPLKTPISQWGMGRCKLLATPLLLLRPQVSLSQIYNLSIPVLHFTLRDTIWLCMRSCQSIISGYNDDPRSCVAATWQLFNFFYYFIYLFHLFCITVKGWWCHETDLWIKAAHFVQPSSLTIFFIYFFEVVPLVTSCAWLDETKYTKVWLQTVE